MIHTKSEYFTFFEEQETITIYNVRKVTSEIAWICTLNADLYNNIHLCTGMITNGCNPFYQL